MNKIVLVNINNNPKTKIPDWFIDKAKELFINFKFVTLDTPVELRVDLKDAKYILGWAFPKTFIKKNEVLEEIFLFSSQVPESFYRENFKLHNISGLNTKYVVNYINKIIEKNSKMNSILIMGKGYIGEELKSKLDKYNVKILTRNPKSSNEFSYEHSKKIISKADIIVPAVSLNRETKELFNQNNFYDYLKKDVLIINTTRGELFDETELVPFLKNNTNAFYHTDVTFPEPYPLDGELRKLENVLITDHIAGFGEGLWENIFQKMKEISSTWS